MCTPAALRRAASFANALEGSSTSASPVNVHVLDSAGPFTGSALDLRDQLQHTLGDSYTIERELGGGGMSRVYVAVETAFGRRVVVKLLSPELVAGVNVDRFKREIQVAAKLQHPHIVPVLTAGESDGLPYYTMPFVEGESLRARLARDGPLGINEAVGVLRDVARALDYAHDAGIVHRDIKPDNVLLSRGAATVADFGIAKALSASKTHDSGATLTQLGVSIGTPMYMAPEQAAADPAIDHRADIYAFGCMAYEILAGRPPFSATTPQRLLAAHMAEAPQPIGALRADTPRALSDLIARCLAKEPDARPQSASELLVALESATTAHGDAAAPRLMLGRATLGKALAIYAVACVAGLAIVHAAVTVIGLPDWVFPAALVVLVLVLPLILFTGYAQRVVRRAYSATPTFTPGGTASMQPRGTLATMAIKAAPHLSWRRTARWSAAAAGAFVLLVAAAMAMRAGGIGPFATLLSAGQVERDRPVVVAEFAMNNSTDTTLGRVIAEAVKADLSQSGAITLLDEAEAGRALVNMRRPNARMLLPVAREVAQRTGAKAVIDGSLNPVGAGFVVTLRMVTADSGRELTSFTDAANSPAELIRVVGGLTRRLRGRIGESLKTVRASPPLWQVTTSSLAALEKYTEGRRAVNSGQRAEYDRLLKEAIQLDTNFAAAYISLASNNINANAKWTETTRYLAKVHGLSDRLGDRDRWAGEQYYYTFGPVEARDYAKAAIYVDSARRRFTTGPLGALAANTVGMQMRDAGDTRQADSAFRVAMTRDPDAAYAVGNLITAELTDGRVAAAESTFNRAAARFAPAIVGRWQSSLWMARGDYTRAESLAVAALATARTPDGRAAAAADLARIAEFEGRLADAQRNGAIRAEANEIAGIPAARVTEAAQMAERIMWATGDTSAAVRVLDDALRDHPLAPVEDLDRPYGPLASAYAHAGRPQRARTYFDALVRQRTEGESRFGWRVPVARAQIAMADQRWDDAIKAVSGPISSNCRTCLLLARGMAHDGRGNADSAIVWYERFMIPLPGASVSHAPIARRLGELYEAKGDLPRALKWYEEFLSSWRRADAVLQPQVADVRQRVVRLHARERAAR